MAVACGNVSEKGRTWPRWSAAVHYRRLAATQTERADDLEADDARGKQAAWEAGREAADQAQTAYLWRRFVTAPVAQNRLAVAWNARVASGEALTPEDWQEFQAAYNAAGPGHMPSTD